MKIILTIIICLAANSLMFAETLKIAYLDTDRIMEESEITKDAQRAFTAEREQWEQSLAQMDREIERLETEYEARKLTLTEAGKAQAEQRIQEKRAERRRFIEDIFGESGKAMQRNAELLEPIMMKLKDSLESIALENDYAIIFDAIGGGILYARPNLDITDLVIQDLNEEAGN